MEENIYDQAEENFNRFIDDAFDKTFEGIDKALEDGANFLIDKVKESIENYVDEKYENSNNKEEIQEQLGSKLEEIKELQESREFIDINENEKEYRENMAREHYATFQADQLQEKLDYFDKDNVEKNENNNQNEQDIEKSLYDIKQELKELQEESQTLKKDSHEYHDNISNQSELIDVIDRKESEMPEEYKELKSQLEELKEASTDLSINDENPTEYHKNMSDQAEVMYKMEELEKNENTTNNVEQTTEQIIYKELDAPKNELDKEMNSNETKEVVEQIQEIGDKLEQSLENLAKKEFGDENQDLINDFVNSSKEFLNDVVDENLSSEDIKKLVNSSKEDLLENFDNELTKQSEEIGESKENLKASKNELDGDFEETKDEENLKTKRR